MDKKEVKSAIINWREEKRSSYLYQQLATIEPDPQHQTLFNGLSKMAEKQAAIWAEKLMAAHVPVPVYRPDLKAKWIILLVRYFGARSLRIVLATLKVRGMSIYQNNHLLHNGKYHGENQHRNIQKGNNIRAAVFGANDGLISNASLILGIAGAHGGAFIVISGIVGLLAGACSMAAGEYVSVRSQREILEYQLALERDELALYPEEEAAELAYIYQVRGVPKALAEETAQALIKDPEKALHTLAREELGINPDDLASPLGAALSSFISFAVGAFVPVVPFLFTQWQHPLIVMIVLTACALFLVGTILSLFTQRGALWSGLRMLLIGSMAGSLTYFIGHLFGI